MAGRALSAGASAVRVEKPWGFEEHWAVTPRYAAKILHVRQGEALSLQYHVRKDETLMVVRGVVDFDLDDNFGELVTTRLLPGDTVRVLPQRRHRITALEDCELLEVSTPELDDVVRLEDRYGRETQGVRPLTGATAS